MAARWPLTDTCEPARSLQAERDPHSASAPCVLHCRGRNKQFCSQSSVWSSVTLESRQSPAEASPSPLSPPGSLNAFTCTQRPRLAPLSLTLPIPQADLPAALELFPPQNLLGDSLDQLPCLQAVRGHQGGAVGGEQNEQGRTSDIETSQGWVLSPRGRALSLHLHVPVPSREWGDPSGEMTPRVPYCLGWG